MAEVLKDKASREVAVGSKNALMDVVQAMQKLTLEEKAQLLEYLSRMRCNTASDGKRLRTYLGKILSNAASAVCLISPWNVKSTKMPRSSKTARWNTYLTLTLVFIF